MELVQLARSKSEQLCSYSKLPLEEQWSLQGVELVSLRSVCCEGEESELKGAVKVWTRGDVLGMGLDGERTPFFWFSWSSENRNTQS